MQQPELTHISRLSRQTFFSFFTGVKKKKRVLDILKHNLVTQEHLQTYVKTRSNKPGKKKQVLVPNCSLLCILQYLGIGLTTIQANSASRLYLEVSTVKSVCATAFCTINSVPLYSLSSSSDSFPNQSQVKGLWAKRWVRKQIFWNKISPWCCPQCSPNVGEAVLDRTAGKPRNPEFVSEFSWFKESMANRQVGICLSALWVPGMC